MVRRRGEGPVRRLTVQAHGKIVLLGMDGANMTRIAVAHGTYIPFVSTCPWCGNEQAQWYSHLALSTQLRRGRPIEGYCVMCQAYWPLESHERSDLAGKWLRWLRGLVR
jgi:hypothetical protein